MLEMFCSERAAIFAEQARLNSGLENVIVMLNKTIKNYNLIKLTKLEFAEIFSSITNIIQGAIQYSNSCLMLK